MDTTPDKTYARSGDIGRQISGFERITNRLSSDKMLLRRVLIVGGIALTVVFALFSYLFSGRYTGTNDSYVRAAQLLVAPDISGTVESVNVREGQAVKAGDVLYQIDRKQYQIALDTAKSVLAQTALDIQAMKNDYSRMLSEIEEQSAQVALGQRTYNRASQLVKRQNTSVATYDEAQLTLAANTQKLQALKDEAAGQLAKLGGRPDLPLEEHPLYLKAKAAVDEAQRQLDHTTVRAPFDGIVAEVDSLQPGTLIVSALSSFSTTSSVGLVSSRDLWVESHMKETDLTYVKVGDPVTIKVDTFPGRKWTGHVDAVSPATGASFSILPPQNASGNWVKVVQRVPVRIVIDHKEGDPQLRAGLSTEVKIDTGQRRWHRKLFGAQQARSEESQSVSR